MGQQLRVGIVGANAEGQGWAPISHFPALQHLPHDYEIAAVCTAHADTAAAAARTYGVARAFHDYQLMVRDAGIDLVSVVVKAPSHHAVVMAALAAGKHVYCEWPLGANTAQAAEMAALAKSKGVKAMVGLQARGDPALRHLRQLIADGYVGDVVAVNMTMFTGGILERPASRLWDRDRAQDGAPLAPLEVPGHFTEMPPDTPAGTCALTRPACPPVPRHCSRTGRPVRAAAGRPCRVRIRSGDE